MAAKLDVSQVIRDPRVPVHFGNKVSGEGCTEKKQKRLKDRAAASEVMQLQKPNYLSVLQDRQREESGSVKERQRRVG